MNSPRISLNLDKNKKTIVFIYYNSSSHGSFLKRANKKILHFSKIYNIILILGKKDESKLKSEDQTFKLAAMSWPVSLIEHNLTENTSFLSYIKAFCWMLAFLIKNNVKLVYIMDYIYWKPAELLACMFLKIPTLAFIAFYKESDAFKGFLPSMSSIVVNSKKTAENFIHYGLKDKTRVMYNFIDPEEYSAEPCSWKFEDAKELMIGYVGILRSIKGVEYLIDAAPAILKKYPRAGFVIVGGEKEEGYEKLLKEKVEKLNLAKSFLFTGHRNDIPNVMASLDILVVPSLDEPFGYINIEAGASALPVVASRVGGIPEIVDDGKTGLLFEAKNSVELAVKVISLMESSELRKRLGKAAREKTINQFSDVKAIRDWEEIFENLVK